MKNRSGFRGYIGTRMAEGRSAPQHIQQMVMRDYCQKKNMAYLLAAVEYRMEGCTMILDAVLSELDSMEGIVMYSIFLLPESRAKRHELYRRVFDKGGVLHLAAENIVVANEADAIKLEESFVAYDAMRGQTQADFEYLKKWDSDAAA